MGFLSAEKPVIELLGGGGEGETPCGEDPPSAAVFEAAGSWLLAKEQSECPLKTERDPPLGASKGQATSVLQPRALNSANSLRNMEEMVSYSSLQVRMHLTNTLISDL